MFIAVDRRFAGLIAVADPIKASSFEGIQQLKRDGIKIVMVTGDNHTAAAAVASKLGIEFEQTFCRGKRRTWSRGCRLWGGSSRWRATVSTMLPALAQANVGIAMCRGADVAIAAGGITLVSGDLRGIVKARKLSQKTMGNIRQNLFCILL
jgi:P-type Cu+ transporter